MSRLTTTKAAIVAAAQASEAVVELLRFAREGEHGANRALDNEPIERLAEALVLAIEIEGDCPADPDYVAAIVALGESASAFIEGWA